MDRSMHIYFSGVGGAGIGPLALIAHQSGFTVSGSDIKENDTVQHLRHKGLADIHIGQSYNQIAAIHAKKPIDWYVYTSALTVDQPDAPELRFCAQHGIRTSERNEFLRFFIEQKNLQMIAIAGTHGKTTTTAMVVWTMKQLNIPVSYSIGGKVSFGNMGDFDPESRFFVYEADEYKRNFLAFHPLLSIITGIDWDHPDVYPTRASYNDAFRDFIHQSQRAVVWQSDADNLGLVEAATKLAILNESNPDIDHTLRLLGHVNRLNAWQVAHALHTLCDLPLDKCFTVLNSFPGVSRRFEQLVPNLYTDYAHTPSKIRGALQVAHEVKGQDIVVVYEGLHNLRQHFIRDDLKHLFDTVKQVYIVPSYLAREDPNLPLLNPSALRDLLSDPAQRHAVPSQLNSTLANDIRRHLRANDLVICFTAGGGGSLDEWLRRQFL